MNIAAGRFSDAHVDCPHCDAAIYESATPHENIAWGSVIACWSCGGPVRLGASPFLRRLR